VRNLRQRSLRVGERNADTLWPVCLCRVQSQSVECQRSGIPTVPPTYTWAFIYSTYTDYSCASTAINEHDFTGLCFFDSNNTGHYSYIFICQSAGLQPTPTNKPTRSQILRYPRLHWQQLLIFSISWRADVANQYWLLELLDGCRCPVCKSAPLGVIFSVDCSV
jgi:hypothetical protein